MEKMNKKQLIMDKAIELFAEKGIDATSVQQITEQSGMSKGAFYLSFHSKDELIISIIDYFLERMIDDLDRLVSGGDEPQKKLFELYYYLFKLFKDNSDFAKVFIKEKLHTLNQELLVKINYYDEMMNQSFLQLLNELYGNQIYEIKYDLLVVMKGFINVYSHFVFSINTPLNLRLLCQTLVEKTNILANYSQEAFLNEELIQQYKQTEEIQFSPNQVTEEIARLKIKLHDPIELESLMILKEQVESEKASRAMITGMLKNLKHNEECHWLVLLVNHYILN